ncbi:MAG TPA: hypothetical protein VE861_03830 [Gemmatimonadaceae bacterium]|nr:hypothetical protein [Gemmatimonadaceae bacterium]
MLGCFRRLITLVILVVVALAAWLTRDRWLPPLRRAIGAPAATVADSSRGPSPADTGWMPVTYRSAQAGRQALTRLRSGKGPAFVTLSAAQFAGAMLDSLTDQLPASTDSLQVRTSGNEFQVRARVRLGDLGGRAALGPLASMLGDRERLTLGGTLEPAAAAGLAQFRLTRVRIGDFPVPGPVIPRLVKSIKRQQSPAGVDASALPVRLPSGVGDIRAAQGKITIYRAAP